MLAMFSGEFHQCGFKTSRSYLFPLLSMVYFSQSIIISVGYVGVMYFAVQESQ